MCVFACVCVRERERVCVCVCVVCEVKERVENTYAKIVICKIKLI